LGWPRESPCIPARVAGWGCQWLCNCDVEAM